MCPSGFLPAPGGLPWGNTPGLRRVSLKGPCSKMNSGTVTAGHQTKCGEGRVPVPPGSHPAPRGELQGARGRPSPLLQPSKLHQSLAPCLLRSASAGPREPLTDTLETLAVLQRHAAREARPCLSPTAAPLATLSAFALSPSQGRAGPFCPAAPHSREPGGATSPVQMGPTFTLW